MYLHIEVPKQLKSTSTPAGLLATTWRYCSMYGKPHIADTKN